MFGTRIISGAFYLADHFQTGSSESNTTGKKSQANVVRGIEASAMILYLGQLVFNYGTRWQSTTMVTCDSVNQQK